MYAKHEGKHTSELNVYKLLYRSTPHVKTLSLSLHPKLVVFKEC